MDADWPLLMTLLRLRQPVFDRPSVISTTFLRAEAGAPCQLLSRRGERGHDIGARRLRRRGDGGVHRAGQAVLGAMLLGGGLGAVAGGRRQRRAGEFPVYGGGRTIKGAERHQPGANRVRTSSAAC